MALLGCMVAVITSVALMAPAISMTAQTAQDQAGARLVEQEVKTVDEQDEAPQDTAESSAAKKNGGNEGATSAMQTGDSAGSVDADDQEASKEADESESATQDDGDDTSSDNADDQRQEAAAASEEPNDSTYDENLKATDDNALAGQTSDLDEQSASSSAASQKSNAGQTFAGVLKDANGKTELAVDVEAPAGALPEGAIMQIAPVERVELEDAVTDAMVEAFERVAEGLADNDAERMVAAQMNSTVRGIQAVDISFVDEAGNKVEPAMPVSVRVSSDAIKKHVEGEGNRTAKSVADNAGVATDVAERPLIVHIADDGHAEMVDVLSKKDLKARDLPAAAKDELVFESDAFSAYAIVFMADSRHTEEPQVTLTKKGRGDTSSPYATKTVVPNGDGTYTLTLSVTTPAQAEASSSRANVVVIFDSSNSMYAAVDTEDSYFEEDPIGCYGTDDGMHFFPVIPVGTVVFRTDENGNMVPQRYTGTRYKPIPGRMGIAKSCSKSLGERLLHYNDLYGDGTVEIAFVEFATRVKRVEDNPTQDEETFNSWVDECFNYVETEAKPNHVLGGTNWEGALLAADAIDFGDDDPVYIVFVSDGNPTCRISTLGYQGEGEEDYDDAVTGGLFGDPVTDVLGNGNTDPHGWNYEAATNEAQHILDSGKYLYNIGIFGDADRMASLPGTAYYSGTDQTSINAAFDNILEIINSSFGYSDVQIKDGITSLTTSAFIRGGATNFEYSLTLNGQEANERLTDGQQNAQYLATSGNDQECGQIVWDLGDDVLINGATYSMSCIIWPSQEAYDLVADLNNNPEKWDTLEEWQKAQVELSGSTYVLKTNTFKEVTGKKYETSIGEDGTVIKTEIGDATIPFYEDPNPMPLDDSKVTVQKIWSDSLAESEYNELMQDNDFHVWLNLMRGNEDYLGEPVIISKPDNYMDRIWPENDPDGHHIATGLMVSEANAIESGLYGSISNGEYPTCTYNGTLYYILDPGYDYYFEEHVESHTDYHFELENKVFHPMVVDGVEQDVTFNGDVVQDMQNLEVLTAVNSLKGGINIQKKIVDDTGNEIDSDDTETEFTIHGSITKNGEGTTLEYRYFGSNYPEGGSPKQTIEDSSNFTVSVKVGETLRIINVPSGYTYQFYESAPPSPYEFYSIEGQAIDGDGNVVAGATISVDGTGVLTGTSVSNAAQNVTVKNHQKEPLPPKPGSLVIRKTIAENGEAEVSADVKSKLAGTYSFTLYVDEECTEPYYGDDGTPVTATVSIGADGAQASSDEITNLPAGDYWIKETLPSNDSLPVVNPVKVTVQAGKTGEEAAFADFVNDYETTDILVKKEWSDTDEVDHSADTITFALYQVAEDAEGNVVREGEYAEPYTKTITGNGEVAVRGLPVNGVVNGEAVTYHYYVSETAWKAGYVPVVGYTSTDEGQEWAIRNVAPQPPDKPTSVSVTKLWKDQDGNDVTQSGHDDDVITFKLIQTAVESNYVPVTVMLHNSDGSEYSTKTYFVEKNGSFTLTLNKPGSLFNTGVMVTTDQGGRETWSNNSEGTKDFTFDNIDSALTINANLNRANWAERPYNIPIVATYWSHSVSGTELKESIDDVITAASGADAVSTQDYVYTLHKNQLEGAFSPSASGWVGTVDNLPLYKKISDSVYYVYSYAIDEVTVNGETVIEKETTDNITTGHTDDYAVEVNQETNTIINTARPKVDVEASKKWENADNTDTAPNGGSVTFELYADGKATGKTVVLDGVVDTPASCYESAAWTALWKDLPEYSDYGNTVKIDYVIKEIAGFSPYVNQNPAGVPSEGTITNKVQTFDLELLKVDENDSTIVLENATFTLRRIVSDVAPGNEVKYDGDILDTKTTGRDGTTTFEGIPGGYYEVRETQPPAGYITSGDSAFYIKVDRDGVHLISCDLTAPAVEWQTVSSGGIVGEFAVSGSETPAQATVENEPGAALPVTGGPGIVAWQLIGLSMVLGAGFVLATQRRRGARPEPGRTSGRQMR